MNEIHLYSFLLGSGCMITISVAFFIYYVSRMGTKPITKTIRITETVDKIVYKDREPTPEECVAIIKLHKRDDLLFKPMTVMEAYEMLKTLKQTLSIDPTKRNSLQPSNQQPTMSGEMEITLTQDQMMMRAKIEALQKAEREGYVPHEAHEDFEHSFFGTGVSIGNWTKQGLENRLHLLEVSDNILYIDQQPHPINPSDLFHIKSILKQVKNG